MPTLDWLDREQAMRRAENVPYRLLESVTSHGDPDAGPLFRAAPLPELAVEAPGKVELPQAENLRVEATDKGTRIVVSGHVSDSLAEELKATQRGDAKKEELERRIEQHNAIVAAQTAPVSRGEKFSPIPYLCYRSQGELHLVEREAVFDQVDLDLLAEKVSLPDFRS